MGTPWTGHDGSPSGVAPSPARREAGARRDERFRDLEAAVAHGVGDLPSEVRGALVAGEEPPREWAAFAAAVAAGGLAVTDADVAALAAAHGEDAVFECVVAVAVAAAAARLRAVEALLAESP